MSADEITVFPLGHRGIEGIIASVVLMALAIGLVVARFYIRRNIINAVQSSDWMIFVSLLLSMAFVGFFIAELKYGMGWHQDHISPETSMLQKKLFWISVPFYNAAMITAKASIIIQYFHVFPTKKMRLVCWIMAAILAACGTWMVLSAFLNCLPVASFWDPAIPGHCLEDKALWFSNASLNIFTDMAILIIPIPALASLDLPLRQKVGLCCVFALGWFVCVTSICRLQSLKVLVDSDDQSYHSLAVSLWSAVECNTGIICASLPTLRPAVARIWPTLSSIIPGIRLGRRSRSSATETSFTGGGTGYRRRGMHTTTTDIEASPESASKDSTDRQQLPNVRILPTPGNAFAQDMLRKGSFFEQRPNSYV